MREHELANDLCILIQNAIDMLKAAGFEVKKSTVGYSKWSFRSSTKIKK